MKVREVILRTITHNAIIRNGAMIPFDIPARLTIKDLNTIVLAGSGVGPDGKNNVIDTTLYRVQPRTHER